MIGRVEAGDAVVIVENGFGASRELDWLIGEQLPRIC